MPWKYPLASLSRMLRGTKQPLEHDESLFIMRLEARRVLDASFAAVAGDVLSLDGFTELVNEDLTIGEVGSDYHFILSEGVWNGVDGGGIVGAGTDTLRVDRATVGAYATGVRVEDTNTINLDVDFQDLNGDQLAVDMSTWTGSLELVGVGAVTQSDKVFVSTLIASADNFDVADANNDFGEVDLTSANDLRITDVNQVVFAGADVKGNVVATFGGDVTQTGVIRVGGTSSWTSTDPNALLLLHTVANEFDNNVTINGPMTDVGIRNASVTATLPALPNGIRNLSLIFDNQAIDLPTTTITGDLLLTASGGITQSGAWTVPGSLTLESSLTSDIVLGTEANDVGGAIAVNGDVRHLALRNVNAAASLAALPQVHGDLSVTFDNADVILPSVQVLGDLSVTTNGNIGQSGLISVDGDVSLNANTVGADVNWAGVANDFAGGFTIVGDLGDLALRNQNAAAFIPTLANDVHHLTLYFDQAAVDLPALVLTGDLSVTSGSHITQSGALSVSGQSTFQVLDSNSDMLIDNALNDFAGPTTLVGPARDVTYRNARVGAGSPTLPASVRDLTLALDNADVSLSSVIVLRDLSVVAGGALSNQVNAVIDVRGTAQLQGTSITLGDVGASVRIATLNFDTVGAADLSLASQTSLTGTSNATQINLASTGAILNSAGATLNAGSVTLNAADGIGSAGGLGIESGTISLTSSNGDLLVNGASSALTGPITLDAHTGVGDVQFQDAGTEAITVNSASTATGDISITVANDVTLTSVQAGAAGFGNGLVSITANDVLVDNVAAPDDWVIITAAGAILETNSDTANDISGVVLIANSGTGLGTPLDPLETNLGFIQANGGTGGVSLLNDSRLRTVGTGIEATAGDILLEAPSLRVFSQIVNRGGGDIVLTANTEDVLIRAPVETIGPPSGNIAVHSQSGTLIGTGGLVRTPTGSVGTLPANLFVTATPQDGASAKLLSGSALGSGASTTQATVDSNGFAQIFVWIDDPAGTNFEIIINWVDVVESYPPLSNGGNLGNSSGPPFNGRVSHGFNHRYIANPDLSNPAAPIPVTLSAEFDYRNVGGNGIEFFGKGGVKIVLTAAIDLIPPGEGIAWGITFPEPLVVPAASLPRVVETSADTPTATLISPSVAVDDATGTNSNASAERQLVLRVISRDGEEGEDIVLDVEDLSRLSRLFRRLPDNRYRIYLIQEDGATRLVMDVSVRQGRVTDPSDTADERAERPTVVGKPATATTQVSVEGDAPEQTPDGEPDGSRSDEVEAETPGAREDAEPETAVAPLGAATLALVTTNQAVRRAGIDGKRVRAATKG